MRPASPRTPKVAFVTDIVTPYMVAVLGALAERVDLTALFCARTGTRGADWSFAEPFRFRHRVLDGPACAGARPTPRTCTRTRRSWPRSSPTGRTR